MRDDVVIVGGGLAGSEAAWQAATRGRITVHHGEGTHNLMLFEPALRRNAEIARRILAPSARPPASTA